MVWKGDARNRLAKCLVTLIDEVDRRFPERDPHNDGTIGDKAHQAKGDQSDHNPHVKQESLGIVTALDITHDPASGFDAGAFAESLRKSKDRRIKYVIFNGRIFSSTQSPWVWRNRNKGPGDHSEHVHISVVARPELYDDTSPWSFDLSEAEPAKPGTSRPKLRLGDSGPAVVDLQNLLGITADGEFGPLTDQAVRAFQASRNLLVDGIVGSHTWGLLLESPVKPAGSAVVKLPSSAVEKIVELAGTSELARVRWADRGTAPLGYVKGMAVAFGHVYAKLKAGDPAAQLMAAMNSGQESTDVLAWYDSRFREAGMDNSASGVTTLRHLFALLIGLGMRESSGNYFTGRDTSASNTDADTAEAGLFQMSWNMRGASAEIPKLFAAYSANPEGFLSIFKEGTPQPKPSDQEDFGTGEGVAYQRLAKSCPAFAVETAAVGLRVRRKHWGPINRHEVEVRPEADRLLQQVQGIVDIHGPIVLIPPTKDTDIVPPPAGDALQLLTLILSIFLKEKTMAEESGKPAQGIDLNKILLPILLVSLLSGKQLDVQQLLNALSGGKTDDKAKPQDEQSKTIIDLLLAAMKGDKDKPMGPVNGALGETIGNLLNGKKTALGVIGALLSAILPNIPGAGAALTPGILAGTPLAPVALPIFLALTAWGVLGKMEKWSGASPQK